jgi:uncharacterized protein YcsI (UPF0317 family)
MKANELRDLIRRDKFAKTTSGFCQGIVQANVVILPEKYAFDFFLYTFRNSKACPVIDVMEAGKTESDLARGSDIRTDVPKYFIYENGELKKEVSSIKELWQDDFVTFLLGCSFTFESSPLNADIPLRHVKAGKNVAMYKTNIATESAGPFSGPLVVSMRPIKEEFVEKAAQVTGEFTQMHGGPVHIGDPAEIGIQDIEKPDYGDFAGIGEGEVPVFWACGVTPQAAAVAAKLPIMITHAPGHMFVTDIKHEEL